MSESLSRDQRRKLIEALLELPMIGTAAGRKSLLADIPRNLRSQINCEGDERTFVETALEHMVALGTLDSGESALVMFIEAAWETVKGSQPGQELENILNTLGGGDSRRATLRAAYTDHIRTRYQMVDLRGLVPPQNTGLFAMRVPLREIFVPLMATEQFGSLIRARVAEYQRHTLQVLRSAMLGDPGAPTPNITDDEAEWSERNDVVHGRVSETQHSAPLPLAALADKQPVLIILGDPGSGKSAFLRQRALNLLDQPDGPLPIWLPLAAYGKALEKESALSIEGYAAQFYTERQMPGLGTLFAHARRSGQAIYLLDGLDEVASDWRNTVSDRVVELARTLEPGNRLLATSRIVGYIPLPLEVASEATITALNEEQISQFVGGWYKVVYGQGGKSAEDARQAAASLIETIKHSHGVQRLADNPLTLTMLVLLHYAGSTELPRRRVKLYGLVTRTLIEEWRKARSGAGMPVGIQLDEQEVDRQVAQLAYWMHDNKPDGLATEAELRRVLVEFERKLRPDDDPEHAIRRFLEKISDDAGILSPKGPERWGFSHLTFEEYFAARRILSRREREIEAEIVRRSSDPRWTEVIRLTIAYIGTVNSQQDVATDLLRAILDRDDPYEPYLHRNLLLAGRVLADDPGVDPRLGEEVARRLLDLLSKTQVTALRDSAGEVLLEMLGTGLRTGIVEWAEAAIERKDIEHIGVLVSDPAVRAALLPFLAAPDEDVRRAAAGALGNATSDPAVRAALLPLLVDPDAYVRYAAAQALRSVASDPTVRAVLLALLADPEDYLRVFAIDALSSTTSDPAIRTVLISLLADPEAGVRGPAIEALSGAASDPIVRSALLPLLADEHEYVRGVVAEALGTAAIDPAVCAALLPFLADPEGIVRATAADALSYVTSDPIIRSAVLSLLTDPEGIVRATAARVLGSVASDPIIRAALLPLLADPEAYMRRTAADALGGAASDPAVRAALLPLLADPDEDVREAAARVLGNATSDPAVRAALLPLLADPKRSVRGAAVSALGNATSDPAVRAALPPLLADPEEYVRQAAAAALTNAPPDPQLREQLGAMLNETGYMMADAPFATLARWAEVEDAAGRV